MTELYNYDNEGLQEQYCNFTGYEHSLNSKINVFVRTARLGLPFCIACDRGDKMQYELKFLTTQLQ